RRCSSRSRVFSREICVIGQPRALHACGAAKFSAASYIGRMPHNNGSGFRPVGGFGEASPGFKHMTGAELTAFVPHRPERPEKSEGGKRFKLVSDYQPAGDQPQAIRELVDDLGGTAGSVRTTTALGERDQVLLG